MPVLSMRDISTRTTKHSSSTMTSSLSLMTPASGYFRCRGEISICPCPLKPRSHKLPCSTHLQFPTIPCSRRDRRRLTRRGSRLLRELLSGVGLSSLLDQLRPVSLVSVELLVCINDSHGEVGLIAGRQEKEACSAWQTTAWEG